MVNKKGVSPNPAKTTTLTRISAPSNVMNMQFLLGMANQLGNFSPKGYSGTHITITCTEMYLGVESKPRKSFSICRSRAHKAHCPCLHCMTPQQTSRSQLKCFLMELVLFISGSLSKTKHCYMEIKKKG